MRNFGHNGPEVFERVGINGKNSEFHAALGLANWPHLDKIIAKRREIATGHQEQLACASLQLPSLENREWNCAYYPVDLDSEDSCLRVKAALEANDIHPRRYFVSNSL
jgi:dTDP-4-amino-4,6-dideoxygalactose transaminase